MLKIKPIILSLAVAVLMLFTGTEVMAGIHQSCTAGAYTIWANPEAPIPVTVACEDRSNPDCANYLAYNCATCPLPYFVYPYIICKTGTGPGTQIPCDSSNISRLDALIPVCEIPITILAAEPAINATLPPGTPDNVLKVWPMNIWDSYVIAWTANYASGKLWIATNTAGIGTTSMALKSGNTISYCAGGIAGPGCPCGQTPATILPGNVWEIKRYGKFCFKVERDYVTWCPKRIWDCSVDPEVELFPNTTPPMIDDGTGAQPLMNCMEPSGNQRCPECFIYSGDSSCVWIFFLNRWTKTCS
jgi:hypothetical protein